MKTGNIAQRPKEEWLKILDKGMLTIPKKWREELGFEKGKVIKAKKTGRTIVIEPIEEEAPYRLYTDKEISEFLKADKL